MTSRSRFYVDTPRDPSQRHSMFVSHSELVQDQSSNSSSATLPSAVGSVDRLTGLEEKKSSRFFTLKPKGTFSFKPFFKSSSSSLVSLSPGKRRKASSKLERRDSSSQTEEARPEFGDIGVQTLNASTVDVPVQTCFEAWEEGDSGSFGQRRLAYAPARASPFWNRPYASSSGLSNYSTAKNVPKDSLASPKVVKYVAPGDYTKTSTSDLSAVSRPSVNRNQPVSSPAESTNARDKHFSAKEPTGNTISESVDTQCQTLDNSSDSTTRETYDNLCPSTSNSSATNKSDVKKVIKSDLKTSTKSDSSPLPVKSKTFPNSSKSTAVSKQSEIGNKSASSSIGNKSDLLLELDTPVDSKLEVSDSSNNFNSQIIEHPHPISVLKVERIDSPSRRSKTVHFDLPGSEPQKAVIENPTTARNVFDLSGPEPQKTVILNPTKARNVFDLPGSEPQKAVIENPTKARNVDKDFEALLRDLNVWTDEDENTSEVKPKSIPPKENPVPILLSPNLKSAIDILKQDFLAPIPESSHENNSDEGSSVRSSLNTELEKSIELAEINAKQIIVETVEPVSESKPLLTRSISEYENQVPLEVNKTDSSPHTSESIFTLLEKPPNAETDSLEGNVYDNVIKEENPVQTVSLPTVPSFFKPPSLNHHNLETTEIVENIQNSSSEYPLDTETELAMPLDTDLERNRLSRSSSRSSVRSSSKTVSDIFHETSSKFDSCENLDQLEEEIIRSLYTPDEGTLEDTIMNNIDLPPSESFQNSGTAATHMRRVILDQLLSGKSVEDIVPNYSSKFQRTNSVPEAINRHKPPQKFTAVLTRMGSDAENQANDFIAGNSINNSYSLMNMNLLNETENNKDKNEYTVESPKKASIFMFPEIGQPNSKFPEKSSLEIFRNCPTGGNQPPVLEVRRSSWTPQSVINTPTNSGSGNKIISTVGEGKSPDNKPEPCDFTNCLKPSKIQNSAFIAKLNTRPMSPCSTSHLPSNQKIAASKISPAVSPVKKPEAVGECKYENCLKPSKVQNSLFTTELSDTLRAGSPLTVRMDSPLPRSINLDHPVTFTTTVQGKKLHSPLPTKADTSPKNSSISITNLEDVHSSAAQNNNEFPLKSQVSENLSPIMFKIENKSSNESITEPTNHVSQISITLQPSTKHSNAEDTNRQSTKMVDAIAKPPDETLIDEDPNKSNIVEHPKILEPIAVAPPPPPPLPPSSTFKPIKDNSPVSASMDTILQNQKSSLKIVDKPRPRSLTPKTPVMTELEKKILLHRKDEPPPKYDLDEQIDNLNSSTSSTQQNTSRDGQHENIISSPTYTNENYYQNGGNGVSFPREHTVPVSNGKSSVNGSVLGFPSNTVITDEPPPPGAVLLDKKITVDGDKVHTDKYYAIPMKEVLKEKTSTTKFIPAPPKYDGIGPTEDGIPIAPRNSVKKENMHNWYKTMFKSLHKADSSNDSQEYIIGYTSEPEASHKDIIVRKKSSTMDGHAKKDANSNFKLNYPSAKSSIEVYNVHPRLIEDYEPGHSSVTDDEVVWSKRYLPKLNTPKPSYEFKNGYESDTTVTRKRDQPEGLTPEMQKMWYREIQKGADIPQFGLGKLAPERPKDPVIGPLPPPPLNYNGPTRTQGIRPSTLPADYTNQNGNGYCQQMNGSFEMQLRQAIHSEMQNRRSPCSNQLSPPIRQMGKSPSRSPDLKIPAQALFDFKAESPKEMSLKKGDMVLLLRQLDKNWYEGELRGVIGIFPISYVEIVPPEHASTPIKPKPEGLGRTLYDFVAQTSIELTVRKGETVILLRRVDTNWFEAIFNNKKGIIPISYIQVLQEPIEKSPNSPPRSCPISPRSEGLKTPQKVNSLSPSAYSSSSTSPLPVFQERKLISKKSSHLVEPMMYRALYSYSPQNTDELELQEGDSVYVVEMCDDGWFVGTSVRTGVFGIFPGNYVEKAG